MANCLARLCGDSNAFSITTKLPFFVHNGKRRGEGCRRIRLSISSFDFFFSPLLLPEASKGGIRFPFSVRESRVLLAALTYCALNRELLNFPGEERIFNVNRAMLSSGEDDLYIFSSSINTPSNPRSSEKVFLLFDNMDDGPFRHSQPADGRREGAAWKVFIGRP